MLKLRISIVAHANYLECLYPFKTLKFAVFETDKSKDRWV